MATKKQFSDEALFLFWDYTFLFDELSNEELGELIRLLMRDARAEVKNFEPSDHKQVNCKYRYIMSRIGSYREQRGQFTAWGKKGGNPELINKAKETEAKQPVIETDKKTEVKKIITNFTIGLKNKDDIKFPIGWDFHFDFSRNPILNEVFKELLPEAEITPMALRLEAWIKTKWKSKEISVGAIKDLIIKFKGE